MFSFQKSNRLKAEILEWLEEGIISEEQSRILFERYSLEAPPPWYRNGSFIIKGLAFFLLACSVFLFISANWDQLPLAVRLATGWVPMLAAFGGAFYFRGNENRLMEELCMFLATLIFGANIALQGQVFHISAYFPDGLLWWMLGGLPVIIYYRSVAVTLGLQIVYLIWISLQTEYSQFSVLGILVIGTFFWMTYQKKSPWLLLSTLVCGYFFMFNLLDSWIDGRYYSEFSSGICLLMGFLGLYWSAMNWREEQNSEKVQNRLNFLFSGTYLFILYLHTFSWFYEYNSQLLFLLASWFFLAGGLGISFSKSQKPDYSKLLPLAVGGYILLIHSIYPETPEKEVRMMFSVLSNLIFFGLSVAYITLGVRTHQKQSFFFGVLALLILAITRYLNFFEDYILMGFGFALAAGLLLLANRIWNKNLKEL